MSHTEGAGFCEQCGGELRGQLGMVDGTVCGVAVVVIREVSARNWICCDACARMLCHACCQKPESGYCDACLDRLAKARKGG